jgi:hypothetical protein
MQDMFITNTAHKSYTGMISTPLLHALPPGRSIRLRLKYAQVPNAMRKASKTPYDAKRGFQNPTRRQSHGIRLNNCPGPVFGWRRPIVIQSLAVPIGLFRLFALNDAK